MKIYFAGSIRGGRQDAELYHKVIAVLTAWLRECDVVVAECTQVSLGVGYELAYAEAHDKEVHIFYRPQAAHLSAMLAGNERFHIHRYAEEEELLAQIRTLWG